MSGSSKINNLGNLERYLIDFSNLKNNLIKYQSNFLKKNELKKFYKYPEKGVPLVCPIGLPYFHYKQENKFFIINKKIFKKKIFSVDKKKYKPAENYFKNKNLFNSSVRIRLKYKKIYEKISRENNNLKRQISKFKKQKKIVGAFQTRNIPHLGHEKIIGILLKKCDVVFVNPVIGPKKKGDIKPEILKKVYQFLANKYYKKKLIYQPVYANMFYAGPREAAHHANLREKLGFNYFIVGRDHAGSENFYNKDAAQKLLKKCKKKYRIKILTHRGSFFCKTHRKVVIKGDCKNNNCKLLNISGTSFRKSIKKKKLFKFARTDLQMYLYKYNKSLFYK